MDTYNYSYRSDSKHETIGRVMATSLHEAREQIAQIKHLEIDIIDDLFVIKKENDHENKVRRISYK